jgi:hypothetical protein
MSFFQKKSAKKSGNADQEKLDPIARDKKRRREEKENARALIPKDRMTIGMFSLFLLQLGMFSHGIFPNFTIDFGLFFRPLSRQVC